jgi:hypothetical protein
MSKSLKTQKKISEDKEPIKGHRTRKHFLQSVQEEEADNDIQELMKGENGNSTIQERIQ